MINFKKVQDKYLEFKRQANRTIFPELADKAFNLAKDVAEFTAITNPYVKAFALTSSVISKIKDIDSGDDAFYNDREIYEADEYFRSALAILNIKKLKEKLVKIYPSQSEIYMHLSLGEGLDMFYSTTKANWDRNSTKVDESDLWITKKLKQNLQLFKPYIKYNINQPFKTENNMFTPLDIPNNINICHYHTEFNEYLTNIFTNTRINRICLQSLPGSGKTTFLNNLLQAHSSIFLKATSLSRGHSTEFTHDITLLNPSFLVIEDIDRENLNNSSILRFIDQFTTNLPNSKIIFTANSLDSLNGALLRRIGLRITMPDLTAEQKTIIIKFYINKIQTKEFLLDLIPFLESPHFTFDYIKQLCEIATYENKEFLENYIAILHKSFGNIENTEFENE